MNVERDVENRGNSTGDSGVLRLHFTNLSGWRFSDRASMLACTLERLIRIAYLDSQDPV
jgi:hypothetical protein